MATTPLSQSPHINTPHSPLHGAKYDNYEPYSSTRRSTRQSTHQRRAAITPEPGQRSPTGPAPAPVNHNPSSSRSKKSHSVRRILHTYSPPSSTPNSPDNGESSTVKSRSRASRAATKINFSRSPSSPAGRPPMLDIPDAAGEQKFSLEPRAAQTLHGLPTPAKTPRKQPLQQKAAVASAARVLFPARSNTAEEAMPKTGKGRKGRQVGFSSMMGGDASDDNAGEPIPIYTDSRDRFPSLDRDVDNPFIDHAPERPIQPAESSTANRRVKRRKLNGVQTNEEIKEAFDHEEGMVYVFRGKKIFKKFPATDHSDPIPNEYNNQSSPEQQQPSPHRHFLRSSIKPRLLFPTEAQRRERESRDTNTADEEAPTDIEDLGAATNHDGDVTEHELHAKEVTTPVKERFSNMPATPPSTVQKTRGRTLHVNIDADVDPGARRAKKGNSPFDGWARRKASASSGQGASTAVGRKREGDPMEKGVGRKVSRVEGESFTSM